MPISYKLKNPITSGELTVTELTFKDTTVKDIKLP